MLGGGAAATVPAQTEEEVGSRGRMGTGPWHRKNRLPQEAWHRDNPLPRQEFKQGGAEMQYPDLHTPSLHYAQGRAQGANGIRIYRSQVRGAQHCTDRQQASLWLVNSSARDRSPSHAIDPGAGSLTVCVPCPDSRGWSKG